MRHICFTLCALVSAAGFVPGIVGTPALAVDVYLTRGDQDSLLEERPDVTFQAGSGNQSTQIHIDPTTTYQSIYGFGASMTDSSAWLIQNELSGSQRNDLMDKLFSTDDGIGISYLRLPMGASDFALNHYTYNDMPPGQTDPNLNNFSTAHDQAYIIPTLQQARALNPNLGIMASPWSAPAWMKSNQSLYGGSLSSANYATYAQYFVRFIQDYAAEGLPIDAISAQNEPLNESNNYPTMSMQTFQQSAFIGDHLGPALDAAGIDTKILAYDHNWDEWNYPVVVMNDPEAGQYVAGSAFHGYAGDVENQSLVHNQFPDREIYFTEISGGEWATDFADNLVWNMHNIIIGATRNWASTAVMWNIALDEDNGPHTGGCDNCRGVVTIDTNSGDVDLEVEYYAIGHASKFVQPGAVRIDSDSVDGVVETVAFRNPDGTEVLIALNPNNSSRSFDVVLDGEFFSYQLARKSAVTFVWQGLLPPPPPGDADGDGDVDLDDYNIMSMNMYQATNGGASSGDFNDDGVVDFQDFVIQALNFGDWPAAEESLGQFPGAGVPEPGSAGLAMLVGGVCLVSRRRR